MESLLAGLGDEDAEAEKAPPREEPAEVPARSEVSSRRARGAFSRMGSDADSGEKLTAKEKPVSIPSMEDLLSRLGEDEEDDSGPVAKQSLAPAPVGAGQRPRRAGAFSQARLPA
mmetsp:Transcript_8030/g.17431  ORF Transcript_8030/g.17431 Transcript_8030/m.17431 type:complete len:115 (-) Transcript_8030:83-427(-)